MVQYERHGYYMLLIGSHTNWHHCDEWRCFWYVQYSSTRCYRII